MKKINSDQEYDCPLCGEYVKLNKKGTMTNPKTGEFIYVYTCEDCNQAFALDDDNILKLIPYDSEMKKIENKCKICGDIENYNQKGLFLLNIDTAYYEFHCFDCAIPILQDWLDKIGNKDKIKITKANANEVYEVYDCEKSNQMLVQMREHPEKYKETTDKIIKEFNNLK